MRGDGSGEGQPLAAEHVEVAAIADAADLGCPEVSRSPSESTQAFSLPTQQPMPLPVPSTPLFASWRTPSDAPPIASTRPPRWLRTSLLGACGRSAVTFAPSTRFDECRQSANLAVRRSGGGSYLPLPGPLLELPLSSRVSSAGRLTASALRAIAPPQPYLLPSSPPIPSLQRPTSSTQMDGVRDVAVDDFSDTSSSADSTCSTNSSSLTLLDSYTSAVRPRPPPSLALDCTLPRVTLRAASEHMRPFTALSLADRLDISAVAAGSAATDATASSPTDTGNATFTLLEPEVKRMTTTTHGFAVTAGFFSEWRHADSAATERVGGAVAGCRDRIRTTRPKDEPYMATVRVTSLLLESLSLPSTPEVSPSTGLPRLPPSPPISPKRVNPRAGLLVPDTPGKQLHEPLLDDAFLSGNAEMVVSAAAEGATPRQFNSSSIAILARSQGGGEGLHEATRTMASCSSTAGAMASTPGIRVAPYLYDRGGADIDAHEARTTASLHASFLTTAADRSSDVGGGCKDALGSTCISASPGKINKDSAAVGVPSPPCAPHHCPKPRSPSYQELCSITSAAAADAPWPPSPRPHLFQHSLESSTTLAKGRLASEADRFSSASDELPPERGEVTPERPSQQTFLSDAVRQESLLKRCENRVATSAAIVSCITHAMTNAGDCVVGGGDGTAVSPFLAKQRIHSDSSDIGAESPHIETPPKGPATAVAPLLPTSPAPSRSPLAVPCWPSFRLSGEEDSGRFPRRPQQQPATQLTTLFDAFTTATTSRPYLSPLSPVTPQLPCLGAPLPLAPQSPSASMLPAKLSFSSAPLLDASPMFCKSPHASTTTAAAAARQCFSENKGPRSPSPTIRGGLELLSRLPPLKPGALPGASTLSPPEGADMTAEQLQPAEFCSLRGCKLLPAPSVPGRVGNLRPSAAGCPAPARHDR
ncbi:hypothetical protein LSCM1_04682 [Leishmania martiniquensis]|uniref:Uncharacterized protein n=1 Tax=Leishmania martiniquensis TaxID=1580590 RepID=A0A836KM44_9TRYP|nr:hypothetical protein LSCM1_04682 [Leishmania martiniquensis]